MGASKIKDFCHACFQKLLKLPKFRFEIVDEEYIEELKDESENENMKKRQEKTEYWKNVFKKWANERNLQVNLKNYEGDVLDQTLSQFYTFRNSVIFPLCY